MDTVVFLVFQDTQATQVFLGTQALADTLVSVGTLASLGTQASQEFLVIAVSLDTQE